MIAESEIRYDAKTDVLYLFSEAGEIARSVEVSPGITVEFGDVGNILGVEILRASKVLTEKVIALLHAKQALVAEYLSSQITIARSTPLEQP